MSSSVPFERRVVAVVEDFSLDEQLYLYRKTAQLKARQLSQADLRPFRVDDHEMGIYLLFLESSTRTKESFRNAALFHRARVNDFAVGMSSLNKEESLQDTVKMLMGYSPRSIFIIRSTQEGLCRLLGEVSKSYGERMGIPSPGILNAGDGRHQHPTQEFLDIFTFLERNAWRQDSFHLALVGDLLNGRTVHTKPEGLRVFREVQVDLIAPRELALPETYVEKMHRYGFQVRTFETIAEYLSQKNVAPNWYFTRLQLERMGDLLYKQSSSLREAVTFQKDFLPKLQADTKFYHPLPRHKGTPVIPCFLDALSLNGWDGQSVNGYYTRIIEIAMLAGHLGSDFEGEPLHLLAWDETYAQEKPIPEKEESRLPLPRKRGITIQNIAQGKTEKEIWRTLDLISKILGSSHWGWKGALASGEHEPLSMGTITFFQRPALTDQELKALSVLAPGSVVDTVEGGEVKERVLLKAPSLIQRISGISCCNEACASNLALENSTEGASFVRVSDEILACRYCDRHQHHQAIWGSNR